MAVTNYITINGKIHGEVTGGVTTGYATDAPGSVVATVDSTGNVANTCRYKPYGTILARTGADADPKFEWLGGMSTQSIASTPIDYLYHSVCYASSLGRIVNLQFSESTLLRSQNANPLAGFFALASLGQKLPDCPDNVVNNIKSVFCSEMRRNGFWSRTACSQASSDWCKCTGTVSFKVVAQGTLDVTDWGRLPIGRFTVPCLLKGNVTCKEKISEHKQCPKGHTCDKLLPSLTFKDSKVSNNPHEISSYTDYGPFRIKWRVYDIKLDLTLAGKLSLTGCDICHPKKKQSVY